MRFIIKCSKKIICKAMVLVLIFSVMSGCSQNGSISNRISGKWICASIENTDKKADQSSIVEAFQAMSLAMLIREGTKIEFFKDGTVSIGGATLKYDIKDNKNINLYADDSKEGVMMKINLSSKELILSSEIVKFNFKKDNGVNK